MAWYQFIINTPNFFLITHAPHLQTQHKNINNIVCCVAQTLHADRDTGRQTNRHFSQLTSIEIHILTSAYPVTSTKDQSRRSFYYPHVHISLKCAIHSNRIALHNDRQVAHGSQYTLVYPLVKYSCSLYISFMWGNNDTIHTSMLWEVCALLGVIDNWYVTTKSSRPESIFTRN